MASMTSSSIRTRLLEILKEMDRPVSVHDIKSEYDLDQDESMLLVSLRALDRDGKIRRIRHGRYAHNCYCGKGNAADVAPKPGKKRSKSPVIPTGFHTNVDQAKSKPATGDEPLTKSESREDCITQELREMERVIEQGREPKPEIREIQDARLKLLVLKRLTDIVSSDIGQVLAEIHDDINVLSEAQQS